MTYNLDRSYYGEEALNEYQKLMDEIFRALVYFIPNVLSRLAVNYLDWQSIKEINIILSHVKLNPTRIFNRIQTFPASETILDSVFSLSYVPRNNEKLRDVSTRVYSLGGISNVSLPITRSIDFPEVESTTHNFKFIVPGFDISVGLPLWYLCLIQDLSVDNKDWFVSTNFNSTDKFDCGGKNKFNVILLQDDPPYEYGHPGYWPDDVDCNVYNFSRIYADNIKPYNSGRPHEKTKDTIQLEELIE